MSPMGPDPAIDHGIRYELAAMIARPGVLERIAAAYPAARLVSLEQGLALIPYTRELTSALAAGSGAVPPETGFRGLTPGLHALLTTTSRIGPIAYVEADYYGRDGWQTAAVWAGGEPVYGPELLHRTEPFPASGGGPIGGALRQLGANAVGRRDEFVAVGLGQERRTEAWR